MNSSGCSSLSANGDDGCRLFNDGDVVDVFGYIGLDGAGEKLGVSGLMGERDCDADSISGFNENDWDIAEPQCSDNSQTNDDSNCPFPVEPCVSRQNVVGILQSFDGVNDYVLIGDTESLDLISESYYFSNGEMFWKQF